MTAKALPPVSTECGEACKQELSLLKQQVSVLKLQLERVKKDKENMETKSDEVGN